MRSTTRRIIALTGALAAVALLAAGCAAPAALKSSDATTTRNSASYPVTIENCGRTLTVPAEPKRVVSLWQSNTEALLALGLRDRIVAVQEAYAPYPASVAAAAKGLKSIGSQMGFPSKEVLLSEKADFITGQVLDGFAFDTAQGYASVEQLEQTGSVVYGANLCTSKDAQSTKTWSIGSVEKTLRDYGAVFGASAKAEAVVDRLEKDKKKIIDAVRGKKPVKTAYFNGGTGPLVVLAGGIYDDLIHTAGGENVFASDSVYVSKEAFAASDADVILVGTFPGQDFATQKTFLDQNFPELPAVKNGRISEVPTQETDSSISVMVGLTKIANAIHPGLDLSIPSS